MAGNSTSRVRWHEVTKNRFEEAKNKPSPHRSSSEDDIDGVPLQNSEVQPPCSAISEEQVTVYTRLNSSNKGFRMLSCLGWKEGQPLGLSLDARVDPIPFNLKQDFLGLGKREQDSEVIIATVSQRRDMDSERQVKESMEERKAREEKVALLADRHQEITSTLRAFYCQLCDKQFKNVAQYDEHTNSYAHHHKARAKDMQASIKPKSDQASINLRKEKERLREERVLRKMAKAAGVKIGITPTAMSMAPSPAKVSVLSGVETINEPFEPKQTSSGWVRLGASFDSLASTGRVSILNPQTSEPPEYHPPPPPPPDNTSPPPPPLLSSNDP